MLVTDLKNTNLVMLSPYESENNSLQNFQFSKRNRRPLIRFSEKMSGMTDGLDLIY
jgi:hypothetical protein